MRKANVHTDGAIKEKYKKPDIRISMVDVEDVVCDRSQIAEGGSNEGGGDNETYDPDEWL